MARNEGGSNGIDALLPPEIAIKAENAGVAKARQPLLPLFALAVLAGAFIAMGAVFSTVTLTGASALPFGVARALGGLTFCLGLILVIVGGAELFTGNALLVMALVSRKITLRSVLRNWCVVYLGNAVGAVLTAALMFLASEHQLGGGQVGLTQLNTANAKLGMTFVEAFSRGVACNALVCLAVWLCLSCRTTGDKVLAILFPISAFVAAGFEHSVANIYLVPVAIFVRDGAGPEFWTHIGGSPEAWPGLTWGRFLLNNLLPVTLGNILGGTVFVGLTYWMIYRYKVALPDGHRGPAGDR